MIDFLDVLSERHAADQFDPTTSTTRSEVEVLVQEDDVDCTIYE